jgi:predicted CXXCH cytochrome family protein
MVKRNFRLWILLILVATCGLVSLRGRALSEEGCVTGTCHASLLTVKNLHPVAQMCDSCHQPLLTPHPQKGRKTFQLIQEVPGLCGMCHAPFGKKAHVHPPVKDGMCLTCHNPHGSDEPKLLAQPLKDLCLTCHSDKLAAKFLHGPASTGDCTACHNPHESDNKALTVKEGPALCVTCHFDMENEMKKKDVHPALLAGCPSCHNPHGSPYRRLLSAEGEQLCFQCHPQIGEKVEKSRIVHAPIKSEKGCPSCHSPHASENDKLLAKPGKALCLECHKDIIKKTMKVLHGPIAGAEGKCTPCHDPHGSPNDRLLVKEFPTDAYVPYTDNEFQLCFSCHNRDLLRYPDTSFATGFRDGDRNLHYLHVNRKDKGRNCKLCHNVHGSENQKLIATSVHFGKWELPLKYVKTETGGSCAPGCHKKLNYDRVTPGKEPEAPKPKEKEKEAK